MLKCLGRVRAHPRAPPRAFRMSTERDVVTQIKDARRRTHTKVNHCCDKIDVYTYTATVDKELLKLDLTPQLMCICLRMYLCQLACWRKCVSAARVPCIQMQLCVASSTLLVLQIVIIHWRLSCFSPMIHHLFKCQQMSMPTTPSLENDVYRIVYALCMYKLCNLASIYDI